MISEHTVGFEPADRLAKDREGVRRRFWIKLKRVVAQLPFAEDLLAAYYCAFDKQTPRHVQAALLGAIAYFILPFDFIPDMLPVLGFTDDAAVLATAIRLVATHITPDHRDAARGALQRVTGGEDLRPPPMPAARRCRASHSRAADVALSRSPAASASWERLFCRPHRTDLVPVTLLDIQARNCLNKLSGRRRRPPARRRRVLSQEFLESARARPARCRGCRAIAGRERNAASREPGSTAKPHSIWGGTADFQDPEISRRSCRRTWQACDTARCWAPSYRP